MVNQLWLTSVLIVCLSCSTVLQGSTSLDLSLDTSFDRWATAHIESSIQRTSAADAKDTDTVARGSQGTYLPFQIRGALNDSGEELGSLLSRVQQMPASVAGRTIDSDGKSQIVSKDDFEFGMLTKSNREGISALKRVLQNDPANGRANGVRLRLSRRLMGAGQYSEARDLLAQVQNQGTPDERAVAQYLAGYTKLHEGRSDTAMADFKVVAESSTVHAELRFDAMERYAALAHKKRDRATSWLAYRQIQTLSSRPARKAKAGLEIAGLSYELVLSGKGTWDEVRALCDQVSTDAAASPQVRATAALIHLETHFQQEHYQICIDEATALRATYPKMDRECDMAGIWLALSHLRLDDLESAEKGFQAIADLPPSGRETFAGKNPRAIALVWLAWIYNNAGSPQEYEAAIAALQREFPDSKEATRAAAFRGTRK